MQKVFDELNTLDNRCYSKYGLTEDILMEHAASSMLKFIEDNFAINSKIFIACGSGNNGADGIALARLLQGRYKVSLYIPYGITSKMGKIQLNRAKLVDVKIVNKISKSDVVVDCLFGTGLNRDLDKNTQDIINKLNQKKAYKLACDIPSGINNIGQISTIAFKADTTIKMGALQKSLFTDYAKDYIGTLQVSNLGVQRELYETKSKCFLLEKEDLQLPMRDKQSSHKGTFGHLSVVVGEKKGAGLLCAKAGFIFGSGLVTTIIDKYMEQLPYHIMQNKKLPSNTTAICIGMGLGTLYNKNIICNDIPKVCDADIFYDNIILDVLQQKNIVLTPHPKEFCSLLKIVQIANINITQLQNNRFKYIDMFSKKYPYITILLKGANSLIAQNGKVYINSFGTPTLSKGGTGDVLSGLIGSLLAQGYSCLEAAISGSLVHTLGALEFNYNNYSLTPEELIEQIKKL